MAPDVDLRKVRYFVAVAEELHFGKAAERLFLAQPALSRQIRKLEAELGVDLFVRSSRHVQLTDPGRVLLEEARPLLAAADAARRRVATAGREEKVLRIGFYIGDPISRLVRAFRVVRPEIKIEVARIYWADLPDVLLDGRLDAAFVHLPTAEDGLCLLPLYSTPRLVLLSADHRLAGRSEIPLAEIADEPVTRHLGASPAWEAWHNIDPRPDGRFSRPGPTVANLEEKLQVVGAGEAIGFVPASAASAVRMHPEVVAVPLADAPPTEVCLGWGAGRGSEAIVALVETAKSVFLGESLPLV